MATVNISYTHEEVLSQNISGDQEGHEIGFIV